MSNQTNSQSTLIKAALLSDILQTKTPNHKRFRPVNSKEPSPKGDLKRFKETSSENTEDIMNVDEFKKLFETLLLESEKRTKTTIPEVEQRITEKISRFDSIADDVSDLKNTMNVLQNEIKNLQAEKKRSNIIVFGLHETRQEGPHQISKAIEGLSNSLNLPYIDYADVFRLGRKTNFKTRPLLIKLIRYHEKTSILENAKYLRGTGISISNDKDKDTRITEAAMRKKKQELLQINPRMRFRIQQRTLIATDGKHTEYFNFNTPNRQPSGHPSAISNETQDI